MTRRAPWVGGYFRLLFEPMASRCVLSELEFCLLFMQILFGSFCCVVGQCSSCHTFAWNSKQLQSIDKQTSGIRSFFFHEYGRRVGGVPRSSLKGKETHLMMGKRTQGNPQRNPNQKPKTKNNQKEARGRFPIVQNGVSSVRR